jgi:hypothetical protein
MTISKTTAAHYISKLEQISNMGNEKGKNKANGGPEDGKIGVNDLTSIIANAKGPYYKKMAQQLLNDFQQDSGNSPWITADSLVSGNFSFSA